MCAGLQDGPDKLTFLVIKLLSGQEVAELQVCPIEGIGLLSCKEFDEKVQATENAQLIDVRTPEEYVGGTIGAAVNVDYNGANFKTEMAKLDKERPLFLFCLKGSRSGAASEICKELGFKTIYDLDGGYIAWSQYGK